MTKPLTTTRAAPSGLRFDPLRVLTNAERESHLDRYRSFQEARNGEIDLPARRLSRREAFFQDLACQPVESGIPVDGSAFDTWLSGRGQPPLDARGLFLVVIGKINESERYGIELELARFDRTREHARDPRQLNVFLEEGYHSRILAECCRIFGIDLGIRKPPWSTRWLIHLVRLLPDRVRWIPILCGEIVGCTVFQILLERLDLFADEPEVRERLRLLLEEIRLDEVMHVAFVRARLGPWAMRVARALLPIVARSLTWDVPALRPLGCRPDDLMSRIRRGVDLPAPAAWLEIPATG